tara:strand:+ start:42 stop:626 length:585 start_codon:yes stop_codon:yes gene_type:complete
MVVCLHRIKGISDLEKKILEARNKAKGFLQKKDRTRATRALKQKKHYENMLLELKNILNRILLTKQQQITNRTTTNRILLTEAAKRRTTLKQSNGVISEDARIQRMINRPCFTKCEKKSLCDPTGWCDPNYYCTPSNSEGTASESDMKNQKCVPASKKSKGGKKRKTKKSKKLKRKRKTYKRKYRLESITPLNI